MSNFINKIKKDNVLKNIQDARIEAIDSSVAENSVNPVEGGAVFTALAGKQDMLTAGTNVSIDSNVISATDTTYSAGNGLSLSNTEFSVDTTVVATQQDLTQGLATKQDTLTAGNNIDISNGVISVVGELGVDDYNDLDNKPIINQDLEAVGFTPTANTYYKHTGTTTSTLTSGVIYLYDGTSYKAINGSGSGGSSNYYELDNIPIKQTPASSIQTINPDTKINNLYINTNEHLNWQYLTIENSAEAGLQFKIQDISYATSAEAPSPDEYLWWKDGNTFKYYNSTTSEWVAFTPIEVSDKYVTLDQYRYRPMEGGAYSYTNNVYLNGERLQCSNNSLDSEPSTDEYDVWCPSVYAIQGDTFKLFKADKENHRWIDVQPSDYVYSVDHISTGPYYIFNTQSDALSLIFRSMEGIICSSMDTEIGAMKYKADDLTYVKPESQEMLKGLYIRGVNGLDEGAVIYNQDYDEEEVIGNQWLVNSGKYSFTKEVKYSFRMQHLTDFFGNAIKTVIQDISDGVYYKDPDIVGRTEYMEVSETPYAPSVDVNVDPDFADETPDYIFYGAMSMPGTYIYHNNEWITLECVECETEGQLPEDPEVDTYALIMSSFLVKKFDGNDWINIQYYGNTPPTNPIEGDVLLTDVIPVTNVTLFTCVMTNSDTGLDTTYYCECMSYEFSGMSMAEFMLSPILITDFAAFMEAMDSAIQLYSSHNGAGSWEGDILEINNDLGTFRVPMTVTDIAANHRTLLNSFMYKTLIIPKYGAIQRCNGFKLEKILTQSDIQGILGIMESYWFGWDNSSESPFKYYGTFSQYTLRDSDNNTLRLDPKKNYVFEVINDNPVWFASQGFALNSVTVNDDGSISGSAYCIKHDNSHSIKIKITEGDY